MCVGRVRRSARPQLGLGLVNRGAVPGGTHESATMRFEPSSRPPPGPGNGVGPGNRVGPGKVSDARGDGFAGGCVSLIVLLFEIPVALLLGLTSVLGGLGSADEHTGAPPVDWALVLRLGGFTLCVLVVAVIFLCSGHPFAGAVQLLVAAAALVFTLAVAHDQYGRAHPPSPPANGVRVSGGAPHPG
jgi:hypothetical protein